MLSQPDLPICRHASSQFLRNTVVVKIYPNDRWFNEHTLPLMSVGTLFQETVAGEEGIATDMVVDFADALQIVLAKGISARKALVRFEHATVRDLLLLVRAPDKVGISY